jgi:hypothetical protein
VDEDRIREAHTIGQPLLHPGNSDVIEHQPIDPSGKLDAENPGGEAKSLGRGH